MRHFLISYPQKIQRLLEIAIPSVSWLLITMPFWLSFWHPAVVAYFIITFDVYWFYKSFRLALHAIRSFLTLSAHAKVDWLSQAKLYKNFHKLRHVIIIPEYKEPLHVLKETLDNLTRQDFPKEKLIIVLATEEKDPQAERTAGVLAKEYGSAFGGFYITKHPLVKSEVAGKSSNMAYAGKFITGLLKKKGMPLNYITVTSCDSDAFLHPKYFSYLSYLYLSDPDRQYHFYQGAILFYSNIWQVPLPSRVFNTLNSIWNLSLLTQTGRFINFSTYSLSLATVEKAGFWGVDVIPEDYHLFFKVYFTLGEKVQTRGIYLPVLVQAAQSKNFIRTMINQYEQSKRWAWGVSDLPYVIRKSILHSEIPLADRIRRLLLLLEHHIFWPANWFILTVGSSIPPLINPAFGRTVLGHNLSQISSSILTFSAVFLIVVIFIDWRTKPARPKDFAAWKLPLLYLQWFTIPIVSFFLSAIPGLDAHTRLMLGKRLEYRVTEKV